MNEQNNNKKANKLCLISLACAVGPWLLWAITDKLQEVAGIGEIFRILCNVVSSLSGFGWLAAIVLMIYVRVKYPKNVFGIILMVLYIIAIIVTILFFIFIYIMCSTCVGGFDSCITEIQGCDS